MYGYSIEDINVIIDIEKDDTIKKEELVNTEIGSNQSDNYIQQLINAANNCQKEQAYGLDNIGDELGIYEEYEDDTDEYIDEDIDEDEYIDEEEIEEPINNKIEKEEIEEEQLGKENDTKDSEQASFEDIFEYEELNEDCEEMQEEVNVPIESVHKPQENISNVSINSQQVALNNTTCNEKLINYAIMDKRELYNAVKVFMYSNGVSEAPVDKIIVENELTAAIVIRLLKDNFLIQRKGGYTIGI